MELITKAIKGTQDLLPAESYKNQYVEATMLEIARSFGFREIRTPVFEHTELFQRGVGEATDVVQKEMYTFDDKGGRSITLRPEGTAGAVRAFLEHGLYNEPLPQKMCYFTSCYRYEKPQAGRWREFHQFGVEVLGTASPAADAEVISLANEIFAFLGAKGLSLEINSIGCPECRKKYHEALGEYFAAYKDKLCPTCLDRLSRSPMRILDCKSPVCKEVAKGAPAILDYICDDCEKHFEGVKSHLAAMNIEYKINSRIVRGLDYYTRTVFEFVSQDIGAQGTVCGGGRYDGLVEELGGPSTPSLGFAIGIGRLLLILQNQGGEMPEPETCELYIAPVGDAAQLKAASIAADLRASGVHCEYDIVGRSLKAQMKFADKLGAKFTLVLGDDEISTGEGKIKDMQNGDSQVMRLDTLAEDFMNFSIQKQAAALQNYLAEGEIML